MTVAALRDVENVLDEMRMDLAAAMVKGTSRYTLMVRLKDRGISEVNAKLLLDQAAELVEEYKAGETNRITSRDHATRYLMIGAGILLVTILIVIALSTPLVNSLLIGRFVVLGGGGFVSIACLVVSGINWLRAR
jgi:hypothetical protein